MRKQLFFQHLQKLHLGKKSRIKTLLRLEKCYFQVKAFLCLALQCLVDCLPLSIGNAHVLAKFAQLSKQQFLCSLVSSAGQRHSAHLCLIQHLHCNSLDLSQLLKFSAKSTTMNCFLIRLPKVKSVIDASCNQSFLVLIFSESHLQQHLQNASNALVDCRQTNEGL